MSDIILKVNPAAYMTKNVAMSEVGIGFNRDRTTVAHACHLIEDLRDDVEFDRLVAMAERIVTASLGGQP